MTKQAKILSFDEAKRTRCTPRNSVRFQQSKNKDTSKKKAKITRKSVSDKARVSKMMPDKARVSKAIPGKARLNKAVPDKARASKAASKEGASKATPKDGANASATRENENTRMSFFTNIKKNYLKRKAARAFYKNYGAKDGSDNASSASGEANKQGAAAASQGNSSRAAVYKGQMGHAHRRATRLQTSENANSKQARKYAIRLPQFKSSKLCVCAAGLVCIVVACIYLYPAAQQYYFSVRECDQLRAEYEAVSNRNDAIQSDVNALSTSEGVEDRAHAELGWTKSGEHAAVVRGLEDTQDSSDFTANIVPGSIEAPSTWYSALLDPIFGETS